MSRLRLAVAAMVLLFPAAAPVRGQVPVLIPGMRVRVPAVGEGTITQLTADTLHLLRKDGIPLAVPVRQLQTLDIRGDKDHGAGAIRGAWIGGGIGLAVGVAAWAAGDSAGCKIDRYGDQYDCSRVWNAGDVLMGGMGGALLGAGIGALIGRRSWHTVRLPGAEMSRVSLLPGRRMAFAVSLHRQRR